MRIAVSLNNALRVICPPRCSKMASSPPRSVVTLAGDERVELGVLHAEEPGCEGPYDVARPPFEVLSGRVVRERESVELYVFSNFI